MNKLINKFLKYLRTKELELKINNRRNKVDSLKINVAGLDAEIDIIERITSGINRENMSDLRSLSNERASKVKKANILVKEIDKLNEELIKIK